jgi:hypothetical protein
MIIPIALILISISRTCLITLHIKKRFHTSNQQPLLTGNISKSVKLDSIAHCNPTNDERRNSVIVRHLKSNSFVSSPSSSTTTGVNSIHNIQIRNCRNRSITATTQLRRRRSPLDTQMIILISINVAPFIIVHIITEIAYLFENYSSSVAQSRVAQLFIILIYLSWYLISALRFYTNCLLSRIYREEFKNRLYMLRHGCKPRIIIVDHVQSRRHSSKLYGGSVVNGVESIHTPTANIKSIVTA